MRYLMLIAVLILAAGGYSGYWYILAGGIKREAGRFQENPPKPIESLQFGKLRIDGFPYRLVSYVDKPKIVLKQDKARLSWQGPALSAYTHPWTLDHVIANFPGEHHFSFQQAGAKLAFRLIAKSAQASWVGRFDHLGRIALDLGDVSLTLPEAWGEAKFVRGQLNLRQTMAGKDGSQTDGWQLALRLKQLILPAGLARTLPDAKLDLFELQVRLAGPVPENLGRAAMARWRDDGGTLEVDVLRLQWPAVSIAAKGTLALDAEFRATGSLSARLKGHDALVDHLARNGMIASDQVGLSKAALALLAVANRGEVKLALRLQDGIAWLGPIKLSRLSPLL